MLVACCRPMASSAPPGRLAPRLELVGAALLFSTGGAAIKATSVGALVVAGWRSGIAALALLLLLPSTRRRWPARVWLVAFAYAATLVLFVASNKLTTAANAIFLQSTAPLYIVGLAPWLLGERTRRRDLVWVLLAAVGLAVLLHGEVPASHTAPRPGLGNALALASGVSWALTLVGLRWLARDTQTAAVAARQAVAAGNLVAFLVCLPWTGDVLHATSGDWAALVYLGVVQIGLAYLLLTRGMQRVGALEASLLLLAEPLLNPVWAFLMHGEQPGALAVLGGVLILLATAAKSATAARTVR